MSDAVESLLKSVVFLGFHDKKSDSIVTVGTAFIVALKLTNDPTKATDTVLVTARHVIANLRSRGALEVCVRFNDMRSNSFWRKTLIEDWVYPIDGATDVASYSAKLPKGIDHSAIPAPVHIKSLMDQPFQPKLADEVLIAGLFSPYQHEMRVTPLLRLGNIVSLSNEAHPVSTPVGKFAAHLLEMRSIAGLSGAPVFMKASLQHVLTGAIKRGAPHIYLLGLVSGHFLEKRLSLTGPESDPQSSQFDLNAGVAFVTPTESILEHLSNCKPSDKRTRLYFPVQSLLIEGSLMNALRYLPEEDIKKLAESLPQIASLASIEAGRDLPMAFDVESIARIFTMAQILGKLKDAGWDQLSG